MRGARLVGKTNLHELAMLPIGTNPWYGTPVNPLDPARVPGGSSSGSAVAVANDDAEIALGSDTGGSIRVPAVCCGTTGLKTTHGRVPLDGVWPLAPSLDTVGPMARDVAGLVIGMQLLEPDFTVSVSPAGSIGRLRTSGLPEIEAAVDGALLLAGFELVDLDWDGFEAGTGCFMSIFFSEIWDTDHHLVDENPGELGEDVVQTLGIAELFRLGTDQGSGQAVEWRRSLLSLFDRVELLALPTLPIFPPRLEELSSGSLLDICSDITRHVALFNAAGVPCTAQPVPVPGSHLPASIELVGPMGSEELLLTTAQLLEAAVS